ncbi:hypothetical protein BDBG_02773 [Blastomyces gilchristii SLH14081]|uniref:C2H2-type domain-containing protein n=1 Tax=Blastomyces gilchristii (strain SLH14081) TaxID=559298 RepID=A0A179UEY1_BLAGS|nr:uncharacterized protein BDBG_02773 [Blastomyces gilchristii SLH14081]OAT06586.1 hypothetical protein BDBG_02773 [Blastomyces gilchristii SLH14081]
MAPTEITPRIVCTFENCNRTFTTEKELRKHKIEFTDHEYCARCNLDFEDERELFAHKLESNKHIACPSCGEEFKSEGGKNTHFAQFHRTNQEMVCHFCHAKFRRAHAYMCHIENDQCPSFSAERYREQRVKKEALRTVMSRALGPTNKGFGLTDSSITSSLDGGIGLPLLDGRETVPTSGERSKPGTTGSSGYDATSVSMQLRGMSLWPAPGEEKEVEIGSEEQVFMAYSDAAYGRDDREVRSRFRANNSGPPTSPTGKHTPLIDLDETASKASDNTWGTWESRFAPSPMPRESETVEKRQQEPWSPSKFFSPAMGKWVCVCDKLFDSEKDFEGHIKSGIHMGGVFRCPGCLRMFKSSTALTAHCESATVRCKVNKDENYARILDEVSAGLIEPAGENEDGSIIYRTVAPSQTGIDLKNVRW